MMAGWRLPDQFPDLFIVSWSHGLTDGEVAKIEQTPGIRPNDVLPIGLASPSTGGSGELALAMAALNPEATMFFGLDPAKGMRMMKLEFRQGTEADAISEALDASGQHVIITDELHQLRHLNKSATCCRW